MTLPKPMTCASISMNMTKAGFGAIERRMALRWNNGCSLFLNMEHFELDTRNDGAVNRKNKVTAMHPEHHNREFFSDIKGKGCTKPLRGVETQSVNS
jgi:hypothetical protein